MNPLPPNADELVSAYLDGHAAPDEVVIVESSAELMARVETMRAVTGQLGAPVSAPAGLKEAHLAAALGAFDAMFDDTAATTESAAAAPTLAAVPDPAPTPEPARTNADSSVPSLDAARERRKRRRFSPGVIAAAVAAVMMVAIVSVLSLGGGSTDNLATSTAADSADVVTDAASGDDDAAEFSAEVDGDAQGQIGLSEIETQRAIPTSVAAAAPQPTAAMDQEAMADDAMDEAEEAMEEEAMDDADAEEPAEQAGDEASDASGDSGFELVLGSFASIESLLAELENTSVSEWIERRDAFGQGLFAGCAAEIPELAIDVNSLAGTAFVDDMFVEIHMQLRDDDTAELRLVSVEECATVGTSTAP